MFYDAQVAGLPDAGPHIRAMKRRSVRELGERRAAVVAAVRAETDLRFVNAGGTGSLHRFGGDRVVTELAAGSGPLRPDPLRRLRRLHPAAGDGVRAAGRAAARPRGTSRPSAAATSRAGSPGGRGCRRPCAAG